MPLIRQGGTRRHTPWLNPPSPRLRDRRPRAGVSGLPPGVHPARRHRRLRRPLRVLGRRHRDRDGVRAQQLLLRTPRRGSVARRAARMSPASSSPSWRPRGSARSGAGARWRAGSGAEQLHRRVERVHVGMQDDARPADAAAGRARTVRCLQVSVPCALRFWRACAVRSLPGRGTRRRSPGIRPATGSDETPTYA